MIRAPLEQTCKDLKTTIVQKVRKIRAREEINIV